MEHSNVTVPCACGCGREVVVDGLGSALYVSAKGYKLYCATEQCKIRLTQKLVKGSLDNLAKETLDALTKG